MIEGLPRIHYNGQSEEEFNKLINVDGCKKDDAYKPPRGYILVEGDIPEWMKSVHPGIYYGFHVEKIRLCPTS